MGAENKNGGTHARAGVSPHVRAGAGAGAGAGAAVMFVLLWTCPHTELYVNEWDSGGVLPS